MDILKRFEFGTEQLVASDTDIARRDFGKELVISRAVGAVIDPCFQARGKAVDFALPLQHDRHRANDENGGRVAVGSCGEKSGDSLDCFAEAHVVGQAGAEAPAMEKRKPIETASLILAEDAAEAFWDGDAFKFSATVQNGKEAGRADLFGEEGRFDIDWDIGLVGCGKAEVDEVAERDGRI